MCQRRDQDGHHAPVRELKLILPYPILIHIHVHIDRHAYTHTQTLRGGEVQVTRNVHKSYSYVKKCIYIDRSTHVGTHIQNYIHRNGYSVLNF